MPAFVVTPTGELLIYHGAGYACRNVASCGKTELWASSDQKSWIADIPADWAVGWSRPSVAARDTTYADIKRALRNFDSRTGRFKL